jgi:short-subunit dehydrogenase
MRDSEIKVSCVHPGGIKTNIMRNARFLQSVQQTVREEAATGFDRLARTTPDRAAETIIAGIKKNKGRILIGTDAKILDIIQRLMPASYGKLLFRGSAGIGALTGGEPAKTGS